LYSLENIIKEILKTIANLFESKYFSHPEKMICLMWRDKSSYVTTEATIERYNVKVLKKN